MQRTKALLSLHIYKSRRGPRFLTMEWVLVLNQMLSLSDSNQADVIETFKITLGYLDDLLIFDNSY